MKEDTGAYVLYARWSDGVVEEVARGDNPVEVRAQRRRISTTHPNGSITRIWLADHGGTQVLETLWSKDWD